MAWSLYEKTGENEEDKFLKPLGFSNGKNQEDVVKEVLKAVEEGQKIIFIHGVCGTGKSGIALNIARKLGKTSIVVPIKNLQEQYKKDYEHHKYILNDKKKKLQIHVITGRKNHVCKFMQDDIRSIPVVKSETNTKLNDIFAGKREELAEKKKLDQSADNYNLPCKIELKKRNISKIRSYIKQNKHVKSNDFEDIQDVKRFSVAGACPYWSPVLPNKYEIKAFESVKQRKYEGLEGKKYVFYSRQEGCGFYEQFNSYIDADVIVFNSLKYKLESALNRKPRTEVEIIDECDEFLDSFANQRNLNIERLASSLARVFSFDPKIEKIIEEMQQIISHMKSDFRINEAIQDQGIIPLKQTGVYDLLQIMIKNPEIFHDVDEESYLFDLEETARMFEDFADETYLTFAKKENAITVSLVTTNLEKKFKEMADKNKIIVLMSGTLHSEHVLKNIFGLKDYVHIEAETQQQGSIEVVKTDLEMDCKYANFASGKCSRENYLKALDKCVEVADKPSLVHVNGFNDLPNEQEIEMFGLENLMDREDLREKQDKDKTGKNILKFKEGGIDVLFSTRASRGMDFPGDQCKSIIFTKYPNPDIKCAFWKILHKTKPEFYWDFYKDKAIRDLWQKVYRGLRFNGDTVKVLSPDCRVLNVFEKKD
jgi:Rad3-related DNA helicase